jgi:hypothetical protein
MSQFLINTAALIGLMLLGIPSSVFAGKSCSVCLEDVPAVSVKKRRAIECSSHHRTHSECLKHQVQSLVLSSAEQISELKTRGLSCAGASDNGEGCVKLFPLKKVMAVLGPAPQAAFEFRLDQAEAEELRHKKRRQDPFAILTSEIQNAFNLRCPQYDCGALLDAIEGCNAAVCSEPRCQAAFCYLCLQTAATPREAHLHVRDQHSWDYWEMRPGYKDRYHWLLQRQSLNSFLRIDALPEMVAVRASVLESMRPFLEERKMWPMPAGIPTRDWMIEVHKSDLTTAAKIALFQNEAIFLRQINDIIQAPLVEAEITALGGKVLASLDIRDAEGIPQTFEQRLHWLGKKCWRLVAGACCVRQL